MPINLGTNFDYRGQQFDFERQSVALVADLAAMTVDSLPNGYEVYCKETGFYISNRHDNDWSNLRIEQIVNTKEHTVSMM